MGLIRFGGRLLEGESVEDAKQRLNCNRSWTNSRTARQLPVQARSNRGPGLPNDAERYDAAIAYSRQAGNRDPDIDAATATPLSARSSVIVTD
jgi:hypothetical protein